MTQLRDSSVQTAVEIHEGIVRPECVSELLSRYRLSTVVQQDCEYAKRLLLQLDCAPLLHQHTLGEVNFEKPEARDF